MRYFKAYECGKTVFTHLTISRSGEKKSITKACGNHAHRFFFWENALVVIEGTSKTTGEYQQMASPRCNKHIPKDRIQKPWPVGQVFYTTEITMEEYEVFTVMST